MFRVSCSHSVRLTVRPPWGATVNRTDHVLQDRTDNELPTVGSSFVDKHRGSAYISAPRVRHPSCPGGGTGRRAGFRYQWSNSWRFESSPGHHRTHSPIFQELTNQVDDHVGPRWWWPGPAALPAIDLC